MCVGIVHMQGGCCCYETHTHTHTHKHAQYAPSLLPTPPQPHTHITQSKSGVQVTTFTALPQRIVTALKQGEEHKEKTYRALCCASQPLTQAQLDAALTVGPPGPPLRLVQQTPVRVMHRRALRARDKHVVHMHAVLVHGEEQQGKVAMEEEEHTRSSSTSLLSPSRWFVLHLRTSAGMYIKEFVHGDFGRTVPSVCTLLGCDVDLLLLDVMDVHLDDIVQGM